MFHTVLYGIIAVVVVAAISYLYTTLASEAYIDQPFNLIVVDANGNMSAVAVRPPSLNGVPPTSNVVYTDALGNIGVMSVGDIYTSYQGNSSTKIRNLLTIDGNNNLSTLPTHNFSPCHINGDPNTNPNATINGTPQRDGTCTCRNNWSGTAKGDGCAVCDGYGVTHTDGSFGALAGPDCQYSRSANCSNHGNVNGSGGCKCDPTYAGSACQYSRAATCSNQGNPKDNGECVCDGSYSGKNCNFTWPSAPRNLRTDNEGYLVWDPPAFDGGAPIVNYDFVGGNITNSGVQDVMFTVPGTKTRELPWLPAGGGIICNKCGRI